MAARGVLRTVAGGSHLFFCPGCRGMHRVGPGWSFNGDYDRPTFQPSVLVQGVEDLTDEEHGRVMAGEAVTPRPFVCHSFVTDGRIQFLADSTHTLAGHTVDLAPAGGET